VAQSAFKCVVIGVTGDQLQNTWLAFHKGTGVICTCCETLLQLRFVSVAGSVLCFHSHIYVYDADTLANFRISLCEDVFT
jgi:hypothetical protein